MSFNSTASDLNVYALYPVATGPALSGLGGIAVGPDQNPWFVGASTIGEVALHVSATVVTPPATAAVAGQPFAVTAVVSTFGDLLPTGTVTFSVDGNEKGSALLQIVDGKSQATLAIPMPSRGYHTITAHYNGSPLFVNSTSGPTTVTTLTGLGAPAPYAQQQVTATDYPYYAVTKNNGAPGNTISFSIPNSVSMLYYRIYDVTDPAHPVLLAGPAEVGSDDGSVIDDGDFLADGYHAIAYTTAAAADSPEGLISTSEPLIVDTSLRVVSVSPADKSFFVSGLPGHQITITLSQRLAGLSYDDSSGDPFAKNPYAVYLIPRGSDGTFAAPSGIELRAVHRSPRHSATPPISTEHPHDPHPARSVWHRRLPGCDQRHAQGFRR